jgi:hypothetical protein
MIKRRRPGVAVEDVDLEDLVFFENTKRRRVESFD